MVMLYANVAPQSAKRLIRGMSPLTQLSVKRKIALDRLAVVGVGGNEAATILHFMFVRLTTVHPFVELHVVDLIHCVANGDNLSTGIR